MNRQIERLVKKSGFVFWGVEPWGPGDNKIIDWSCDYSEEFEKYTEMLIRECASMAEPTLGADILKHFGVQ